MNETKNMSTNEILKQLDKETNISDELFEIIAQRLKEADQKARDSKFLIDTIQFNLSKLSTL